QTAQLEVLAHRAARRLDDLDRRDVGRVAREGDGEVAAPGEELHDARVLCLRTLHDEIDEHAIADLARLREPTRRRDEGKTVRSDAHRTRIADRRRSTHTP